MSVTEIWMDCSVCGDEFVAFTSTTRRCPDCRAHDRRPNRQADTSYLQGAVDYVREHYNGTPETFDVEVIGPNLHSAGATFHVHRQGCRDIERDPRGYGYSQYKGLEWRMTVETLTEVCDAAYPPSDFNCESGEYLDDFKVFPCVGHIPD
jgi:hypothetical protein